ncbi:hypothetical protein AgCh_035508 [Apium graveolens]
MCIKIDGGEKCITEEEKCFVKYAELTIDAFIMLSCLEWEPNGSFYQKIHAQPLQHGALVDQSGTSGLININLLADMTDPTLPPNSRKAVLYRPTVTQLIVMETLADHIKFHHGDTVKSPPIINLLEVMGEFTPEQQRAFCQFVTGAQIAFTLMRSGLELTASSFTLNS